MDPCRPYLRWFAFIALAVLGLVGGLNLGVDPYDRFGLNRLGVYISAEREFKSTEFPRFAPDAVLLGNSRAALIDVGGLPGHRFFNAAFGAAEGEEIEFFVQRNVKDQKLVVLGLDLFSFGHLAKPVQDPFAPLTLRRAMEYVLNLQNLEYSVRTITDHLKGRPTDLAANGSFSEANIAAKADYTDDEAAREKVREICYNLARYRFDPARMEALRNIRATLEGRHIPLLVYLAPMNAKVWDGLQGTSGREEMRRAQAAIKTIFPQVVDLTSSEYSAPEGFFRQDPVHFHSAVGQRFLEERVLAAGPAASTQ